MDENFLLLFFLSFSRFWFSYSWRRGDALVSLSACLILNYSTSGLLRSSSWSDDRMSHQLLCRSSRFIISRAGGFHPLHLYTAPVYFVVIRLFYRTKWSLSLLSRAPQIISNMKSQRRRCHITGQCIERERWSGCVVNVSLLCGCWGCYCVLSNNRGRSTANKPALITLAELVLVPFFSFFLPSTSLNIRRYISRRICTLTAYVRACFPPLSKHQNVGWIFFLRFFCCENKPTNKHWKSNVITWSSRFRIAPVFIFWNFWVFPSVSLVTQQDKVKWRESGRQVVSSAWWLCFLLSRPRERECGI